MVAPRFRRFAPVLLVLTLVLTSCGTSDDAETEDGDPDRPAATNLETTAAPAATETTLGPNEHLVATSIVQGEQQVFASPDAPTPFTALPSPTSIGGPLVFLVIEEVGDWYQVYLPIRPNGSVGFVRKSDVQTAFHDYRIEVRLSEFNLKVYRGDEVFLDAPIAVASANTPTPGGIYYTTELLQPPDPNGAYGKWAYGLSGFSEVHQSFNGGPGQLGIHGTNQPDKIGTAVSNGCIRMRNEDIDKLAPVLPLGVPVTVIA